MQAATVNYPDYVRRDTIPARRFTLTKTISGTTTPINLVGADIDSWFVSGASNRQATIGNGITVINAANGVFEIDSFSLDKAGVYEYDIQIEFPTGVRRTWIFGSITIIKDVTR